MKILQLTLKKYFSSKIDIKNGQKNLHQTPQTTSVKPKTKTKKIKSSLNYIIVQDIILLFIIDIKINVTI